MRKKSKSNKGMEKLLDVHTKALEDNSESIVEILELLFSKPLSVSDKRTLKGIRRELKEIDGTLDSLGRNNTIEEEDWF